MRNDSPKDELKMLQARENGMAFYVQKCNGILTFCFFSLPPTDGCFGNVLQCLIQFKEYVSQLSKSMVVATGFDTSWLNGMLQLREYIQLQQLGLGCNLDYPKGILRRAFRAKSHNSTSSQSKSK